MAATFDRIEKRLVSAPFLPASNVFLWQSNKCSGPNSQLSTRPKNGFKLPLNNAMLACGAAEMRARPGPMPPRGTEDEAANCQLMPCRRPSPDVRSVWPFTDRASLARSTPPTQATPLFQQVRRRSQRIQPRQMPLHVHCQKVRYLVTQCASQAYRPADGDGFASSPTRAWLPHQAIITDERPPSCQTKSVPHLLTHRL